MFDVQSVQRSMFDVQAVQRSMFIFFSKPSTVIPAQETTWRLYAKPLSSYVQRPGIRVRQYLH